MSSQSYELKDASDSQSDSPVLPRTRRGCFIGPVLGFLLTLLAVACAIGVGVLVYFASSRSVQCQCRTNDSVEAACMNLASSGDKNVCALCLHKNEEVVTLDVAPVKDTRLPTALYPLHYNLEIQANLLGMDRNNLTFKGYVEIWLRCDVTTDNVTLHVEELNVNITSVKIKAEGEGSSPVVDYYEEDKERMFYIFYLEESMQAGLTYIISMNFSAPIRTDLVGFYSSFYKRNDRNVYLAATQFQVADARKAFPCMDEPGLKATFNITLVRPLHLASLSNMPMLDNSTSFVEDGITYIKDVYQQTPKMSTYLVAFVFCDFSFKESQPANGTIIRTWSRPDALNQTDYALMVGTAVTNFLEEFLNISFHLPKQDMVAVPHFSYAAMENWGLIIYRQRFMLYQAGLSTVKTMKNVAIITSHELAHQWFGNLVTPAWWDDLWLNEGFATFLEFLGVEHAHPEWNILDTMVVDDIMKALVQDGTPASVPLFSHVASVKDLDKIPSTITYQKGCAIIRMLDYILGRDTFKKALHTYLNQYQYGSVTHDDLWEVLAQQARRDGKNLDIKEIMDTWVLQMNYPVVTVQRSSHTAGQVLVSQKRYLEDYTATDPEIFTSPYGYKWTIPLTLTSSRNRYFNQTDRDILWLHWTSQQSEITVGDLPELSDPNAWILANVQMYGFYRVNYAASNWLALCRQLMEDHLVIPAVNRAQIIHDAWSLVKSGDLEISIALKTIEYLHKEREYAPLFVAQRELVYVRNMLILTPVFGALHKFMQAKLRSAFDYFGLNNTGSAFTEIQTRTVVSEMACGFELESCVTAAKALYRDWMAHPDTNVIDPDVKGVVYCYGVSSGGYDEWNFAFKMYQKVVDIEERESLIKALTCTKHPWIINILLSESKNDISLFSYVLSLLSVNPIGRSVAWNYYRANYDHRISSFSSSGYSIEQLTSYFNTEMELSEVSNFLAAHITELDITRSDIDNILSKIRFNIKWTKANINPIQAWLGHLTN